MKYKIIYCFILFLFGWTRISAQTDTLFWFAAPTVTSGHCAGATCPGGQPILFRVSTLSIAATVTISEPANPAFIPIVINVPANSTVSQDVTARIAMIENTPANTINNYGIQIRSDNLITVYYEVNQWYNPEIYALKGKNSLGTEFYISSQNVWDNGSYAPTPYSSFEIVATEDNTSITITPSNNIVGHAAGVPFTITLNKGQSYSARATSQLAANHLMGSYVISDKPIAITISDDSVAKVGCRDLIGDQTIPTNIVGKEYIIMKGLVATDERFFVLATQNNTDITVNGVYVTTINAGQTYSEAFTVNTHIGGTQPFYMYHVSGFQCELGSAILPPIDQCTGSTQVGFTRSIGQDFYLNIMVRAGAEDGFILNNNGPNTIIPAAAFAAVPGTTQWLAAQINLTAGTTVPVGAASLLTNIKDLFHMGIINGSSSVGCRYGYFSDFNVLQINAIVAGTGSDVIKRCYGQTAQLIASGGTTYIWSPATDLDNPNIQTPIASPLTTTKYTVTVSGACNMTDSASVTVYVAPPLLANFSVEHTFGCNPFTANIVNSSYGVTDYNWTFGDGNTSNFSGTTFSHLYTNNTSVPDTFTLSMIATNIYDCKDTIERTIVVYPDVLAGFTVLPNQGCNPLTVTYSNTSVAANSYNWGYGDGGSSSLTDTSHLFYNLGINDTTYVTTLVATSQYNCTDTAIKSITVYPYIKANFTIEYTTGCTPYNCIINNSSISATTYAWDFGDGFNSTQSSALLNHTYINTTSSPISYVIELVVKNAHNCSDTIRRTITIFPAVNAIFTAVPTEGCNALSIAFTNNSTGATNYNWIFGDGGSSALTNPSHIYENLQLYDTNYTTQLIAVSQFNCRDTATSSIKVYSFLNADFSIDYVTACSPFNAVIINNSVGASGYHWDFGNGNIATSAGTIFNEIYYNSTLFPITYPIELIVNNSHNCADTIIKNIVVNPEITSNFTASSDSGCTAFTTNFTNNSIGANSFEWIFGDGTSTNDTNTIHTFNNNNLTDTTYTVQLIASSQYFCRDTSEINITVYPYLNANFDFDYNSGCTPFDAIIHNTSQGASTYLWNFGNGDTSTSNSPLYNLTYTNNTDTPVVYPISLYVQNAAGCIDSLKKQITVYPAILSSFNATPVSGCNPLTVDFANNSTAAVSNQWIYGDGGSSNSFNNSHTYNNSTVQDTVYTTYLITSSAYGCKDTSTIDITVSPFLQAGFTTEYISGCTPFNMIIQNTSIGATAYSWDFGDGNTSTTNVQIINHSYVNSTNIPISFTITLIVQNANSCADTMIQNITVNPAVTSIFNATPVIGCNPLTVNFTNNSVGAAIYEWTYGDGGTSFYTDSSHTFVNLTNQDTSYTIQLIAISAYNCIDTSTASVTVYSYLRADFSFEYSAGCAPFNVQITNSSSGVSLYQWDFGDGDTSNTSNTLIPHLFTNNTSNPLTSTVELIVHNINNCSDTLRRDIVTYPPVTVNFNTTPTMGCNPLTVNFTNFSVNAIDYNWEYGDGGSSNNTNPVHLFTNNSTNDTTYNTSLIAVSQYNCKDTASANITVYSKIYADFSMEYNSGCSPFVAEINNNSVGATIYLWNLGDGNFSNTSSPVFNYTYPNNTTGTDTNTITLIARNNHSCSDTAIHEVIIYPDIQSTFSVSPNNGCSPLLVSFTNTTAGASFYQWSFGDNGSSTLENPTHIYTNNTANDSIYPIMLIASTQYNCSDTAYQNIIVSSKTNTTFSINNDNGCTPFAVDIINNSTGISDYSWDFGDGTTSTSSSPIVNHTFTNTTSSPVTYTIKLTGANSLGCTDSIFQQITIFPKVITGFTAAPTNGCSPLLVSFSNTSTGAENYAWSFGDGQFSTASNPSHLFIHNATTDTTFLIRLIASSEYMCRDTANSIVTISASPKAIFTVDTNQGCSPSTTIIHNHSNGGTQYNWNFGDGTTSSSSNTILTHQYINTTTNYLSYELELTVTNNAGCSSHFSKTIFVYPNLTSSFISDTSGCNPLLASFTNTSTGASVCNWDFDDGSSSSNIHPTHIFTNNTTNNIIRNVTLITISQFGCSDTSSAQITIFPSPIADFNVFPVAQTYPSATVTIMNATQGVWDYLWTFGDGDSSTSNSPQFHFYNTWGSFTIHLKVWGSHCTDTMSRTIQILSTPPISHFTSSTIRGCPPLTVTFTNTSLYGNQFNWVFGDGGTSTQENPTYTFFNPGVYEVQLSTTGYGGQSSYFQTITVFPPPHAFFHFAPDVVTIPDEEIICYDQSDLAVNYLWNFGDGTTSEIANPTHLYNKEGEFDISLIVWSVEHCSDTFILPKAVRAKAECQIIFPNAFTPSPSGSNNGHYNIPDHIFDIFHPLYRGISNYQLEIFNRWGELIFVSKEINIGWDGYYHGELCKQDIYVWKAKWKCSDGTSHVNAGDVTLLK